MERAKAERAFNEKNPWWPKLHGQEREMWRKIKFRLLQRGLDEEVEDIWYALSAIGELFGKDIVADVIGHLFGGDEFDAEGLRLACPCANLAPPKCESLVAFVQARVPADRIGHWPILAPRLFKLRLFQKKMLQEPGKPVQAGQAI